MSIPARTNSGTIDQEPYEIHEKWVTGLISEMDPKGESSSVWHASDKYWRIICFPKGYQESFKKDVSIYLFCVKLQEDHEVSFTIQTIGGKKTKKLSTTYTFSAAVRSRGFKDFIPIDEIDSYTYEGKLKFQIDIKFQPPQSNKINYRKTVGYIGLLNQGSTCYMNSALQCLFHICAFRKIVFSLPTKGDEDITKSVTLALQRLFVLLQRSEIAPSTSELTRAFGWTTEDVYIQNDVQEFMRELIDNIKTKMKGMENSEAISQLFRGKLLNFVRCLEFEHSTENEEEFYDISLSVKGKNSLEESLHSFIEDEFLIENEKYYLEDHGYVDAFRGTRFLELPPVLHIHLKRFDYDQYYGQKKMQNRFEFPFELDMEPYISEKTNDECYKYELFSVLVHYELLQGGHYYAYIRPTTERKWFLFNDEKVSAVDEEKAINDNYGGEKKNYSAYYLIYIRKNNINQVMDSVKNESIPPHILNYYEEYKSKHSSVPSGILLRVLNEKAYKDSIVMNGRIQSDIDSIETIKTPEKIKFLDLIPELKRKAAIDSNFDVSLWTVDQSGFPSQLISPEENVNNYFKSSSRIFVSQHKQDLNKIESKDDLRPFFVSFYDSDSDYPLRFIKFTVLDANSNLVSLMEEVKSKMLIDDPSIKLTAYIAYSNSKAEEVNPELELNKSNAKNGMIVFQKPEINNSEDLENCVKTFKSIDLLPELKASNFLKYNDFINNATLYNLVTYDQNDTKFRLLVNNKNPLIILLRCVRKILNLSNRDSVLLFKKESQKDIPSERPINFNQKVTIHQIIKNNTIYFRIFNNMSQADLEQKVSFHITIVDENLEIIQKPLFLMQKKFTVGDVIEKIRSSKIILQKPIRILQLSGSRIVKIMNETDDLSNLIGYTFRAEIIPENQINCPPNRLVRVSPTINLTEPRNGIVGTPFIARIIDDEKVADTKQRLCKLIKIDEIEKITFAYTNDCISPKNYIRLKDDEVLSDLLKGDKTMIYAFLPLNYRMNQRKKVSGWNSGVIIYN